MEKNLLLLFILLTFSCFAQDKPEDNIPDKTDIRYNISANGNHYIKFTFLNQTWLRYNQSNPGSTVLGKPTPETFDIGLRRTRMQLFGQITDHVFFYTQFGMNNFNYLSSIAGNRKIQAFFHDALGEFIPFKGKNYLKFGGGLTICNGLSRFTQPSIGSIMTLDVPVFAQSTVDQTDEFARKLSFYMRGQIGKFDYRIAITDPFPITTNGATTPTLGKDATFTTYGHSHQYQGFFIYNFFDSEQHTTPYMQGTYLGKKKILNVECGAIFQPNATWMDGDTNSIVGGYDTSYNNLLHLSAAIYLDMPINKEKGTALSGYFGYFNMNYGKNYIRNNGIMNPANGINTNASFNGTGNAYPMFGTGQTIYAQIGYLFKKDLLKSCGTLMPYVSCQFAKLEKLYDNVVVVDAGINWLINGHNGKLSLDFQNRPIFTTQTTGDIVVSERKNSVILQYQIFF